MSDQYPTWQPIETAPKDGTRVLLYRHVLFVDGRWIDSQQIGYWDDPDIEDPDEALFSDKAFWCLDDLRTGLPILLSESDAPTHWMPLPDRPRS